MSAAFTPGPWEYDDDDDTVISSVNATAIACPYWGEDDPCEPFENERVANMRLIAAAPELYEALDALAALAKGFVGSAYIDDAEAALAKARGDQ